jgi:hypothetical protein
MITKDGYAIIPWAKRFVLLYNNEQLSDHRTVDQATVAMKKHRENNKPKPTRKKNKYIKPQNN